MAELTSVYSVCYVESYPDMNPQKYIRLFKTIDGMMEDIASKYAEWEEMHGDAPCTDEGLLLNCGMFMRYCPSFKDVPLPTRETVEAKCRISFGASILLIGNFTRNNTFACEVIVGTQKVYN